MKILFYNPAPSQRRFVPFEAIKGSAFFRRPCYDAMRLSYRTKGHNFYYYDEWIEERPQVDPDILIINIPLYLARYVETTIERWDNKTVTICCGSYPTLFPKQVNKFSRVAVTGDIVAVWPRIISDLETGKLVREYNSDEPGPFDVDRRLETKYGFSPALSQLRTAYGCNCRTEEKDYCQEVALYRNHARWDIDEVVDDVARIKRKIIFLLDDDFLSDPDYAMKILEKCWRFKKMWIFQTTSDIFNYPNLLPALRDNGVRIIYLKEDWLGRDLIHGIDHHDFVKEKRHQISMIHNNRITAGCKLRLGFEGESYGFYRLLLKFLTDIRVDFIELSAQTPLPKSEAYKRYQKGEQIVKDLTLYDQWMPVVRFPGIEPQALYSWMEWLRDRFYSWDSILSRNIVVSPKLGFHNTFFFYLIPNLSYRNNFLEKVGYPP